VTPTAEQMMGRLPYKGGYVSEPDKTTVVENFERPDPADR
jgi:hypothetical protein